MTFKERYLTLVNTYKKRDFSLYAYPDPSYAFYITRIVNIDVIMIKITHPSPAHLFVEFFF